MKFVLIRHSKSQVNADRPIMRWGLSDEGVERAQALSESTLVRSVAAIYASEQTKAIETMVYLAKPNGIPMHVQANLTETTSFTNRFFAQDEHERLLQAYFTGSVGRVAEGETTAEALDRFEGALAAIADEGGDLDRVGVVAHGGVLALLTAKYTGQEAYAVLLGVEQPDVAEFDWSQKRFTKMWGDA